MASICRSGLTGTFCRSCIEPFQYYVSAATGIFAHCEPCKDAVSNGIESGLGIAAVVLLSLVLLVGALVGCLRRQEKHRKRLAWAWKQAESHYTLPNKAKILIGFYMIAIKIEDVYQVFLPPEVRAILQQLRVVISLGLDGIPLACVGVDGYQRRLLFWMLCPLILISLAVVVVLMNVCYHAHCGRTALLANIMKKVLPIVLRIAFLVYPCASPANATSPPFPYRNPLSLPTRPQTCDQRRL
jgi:hypothetical protein